MPEDLPLYPDPMLRSRFQFADIERLKHVDASSVWDKSDGLIEQMEGACNVARARAKVLEASKEGLLEIHSIIFGGRPGAGQLRTTELPPQYRGHDCPPPEFISRSLDNFFNWLTAESVGEIHPVEKAALVLTRIVDIWPFEFGNLTTAMVFANLFLERAGLGPFFVLPEHMKEFNTVIAQAISIETQPLVNAIHKTVKRELETLAHG